MTTNPLSHDDAQRVNAWLADKWDNLREVSALYVACADEDEWLTKRRDGIGASEVGVIIGATKSWSSPYALWWRKTLDWRIPRSEGQRWGHLVEDPIAELFAEEMAGELYIAKPLGHPYSLWRHPLSRWMTCTPDRLAVRVDGVVVPVEIKSDEGGPGWGEPQTDEVPEQYRAQALWQADIFGAPGTYVVRKTGSGKRRMVWYWVPYDAALLMDLKISAADFLASIEQGEPPPIDASEATTTILKHVNAAVVDDTFATVPRSLYEEWVAARAARRDSKVRDELASNRMRAAMGTAQFATYKTDDGLDVVFAKRRIGKRAGYEVGPAATDELRQIGEQREAGGAVPERRAAGNDSAAAAAVVEKVPASGDIQGGEVGGNEEAGTGGEDPRSVALGELSELGSDDYNPFIKDQPLVELSELPPHTVSIHGIELPPELARLVDTQATDPPIRRARRSPKETNNGE